MCGLMIIGFLVFFSLYIILFGWIVFIDGGRDVVLLGYLGDYL